jgi:uncharacterized protein YqeY
MPDGRLKTYSNSPARYNDGMETKYKLEQALKTAMKAGDDVTKRTVRMALAAIRQVEIDKRVSLDETSVLSILQKEIKTRRESVEEASRANRADIVASTQAEIIVLETYLPASLSTEELKALVEAAVAEVGAIAPTDMGKVMKVLMPRVAGRAPGDQVRAEVCSQLQR